MPRIPGIQFDVKLVVPPFLTSRPRSATKETHQVILGRDSDGHKIVNEYVVIKKLGHGSYGKVYLCHNSIDNKLYAVKACNKGRLRKKRNAGNTALADVMMEVAIMKKIDHPNVVKLYEVIDDPKQDYIYLVLEHVEGGAILNQNLEGPDMDEATVRRYFRDMVLGLKYLHRQKVIHRDIKPENLLVAADGTVKISDFGVSQLFSGVDAVLRRSAGSPAFLAPELCSVDGEIHGKPADVWAAGVTLYCFIYRKCPFMVDSGNVLDIYDLIKTGSLEFPSEKEISSDLRDLLTKLLVKDPSYRITLDEVSRHPWVTMHDTMPMLEDESSLFQVSSEDLDAAFSPHHSFVITGASARSNVSEGPIDDDPWDGSAVSRSSSSSTKRSMGLSLSAENSSHLLVPKRLVEVGGSGEAFSSSAPSVLVSTQEGKWLSPSNSVGYRQHYNVASVLHNHQSRQENNNNINNNSNNNSTNIRGNRIDNAHLTNIVRDHYIVTSNESNSRDTMNSESDAAKLIPNYIFSPEDEQLSAKNYSDNARDTLDSAIMHDVGEGSGLRRSVSTD